MDEVIIRQNILRYLFEKETFVKGKELTTISGLEKDDLKYIIHFLEVKGYLIVKSSSYGMSYYTKITKKGIEIINDILVKKEEVPYILK
ncbi:hypothetical protein [Methanococcus maripaludis]|uniref:Putative transcriptional regulator n=1 Tax=Methanococcus maripaludis TaxID=39152 RepID=A0A2L1C8D7_METMI|nr:hypothetical protein [Methanococcus maripaludis]AVB75589.1 hypothetical protein MMJJ_01700 [Methanococcus maripaludis]MBA2853882.1 putative transcriptional regulator [Methanococcus maripaludis]MBA2860112.1 putative transcriptional regulator [Methanococcus maripaludis]MBA2863914.1 putative transcriptional regulator [Methanococcus maripaludis]MBB6496080.1 putative transcriptional regulator [Methanococcus maripaludis]